MKRRTLLEWEKYILREMSKSNLSEVEKRDLLGLSKYNFSEVAKLIHIPNIGENEICIILREMCFLDETNRPFQEHIDKGYFVYELPWNSFNGPQIHVTRVVGYTGIDLVRRIVLCYLDGYPMSKIEQEPKKDWPAEY